MNQRDDDITVLLRRVRRGDLEAQNPLMERVYPELKRMAARIFRGEAVGHSLQPTALIGEVWLRILHDKSINWSNREHFYRVAVQTMRRGLVDHARARDAQRRPNRRDRIPIDDVVLYSEEHLGDILDVHEALEQLTAHFPKAADVVELRYFGGWSNAEIAERLDVSVTTVKNHHELGMAWIESFLSGDIRD